MAHVHDMLLQAWQFRHACRRFDAAKKIPQADFDTILEGGRLSPSSFGFEPWEFLVVQNAALREKIGPVAWNQPQVQAASHLVVIKCRQPADMQADAAYVQALMRETHHLPEEMTGPRTERYRAFRQNDFQLNDNPRVGFEWAARQCYIALGNMMTAAAALGIDSCPLEGFNKEALEALLEKEGLLDRAHWGVACMVAFGYRVQEPRPKTRRPVDVVVEWVE